MNNILTSYEKFLLFGRICESIIFLFIFNYFMLKEVNKNIITNQDYTKNILPALFIIFSFIFIKIIYENIRDIIKNSVLIVEGRLDEKQLSKMPGFKKYIYTINGKDHSVGPIRYFINREKIGDNIILRFGAYSKNILSIKNII